MSEFVKLEQIDKIVKIIRTRCKQKPRVAVILGSGLGALADAVEGAVLIPYGDLPGWPVSTVVGHQGRLVLGEMEATAWRKSVCPCG